MKAAAEETLTNDLKQMVMEDTGDNMDPSSQGICGKYKDSFNKLNRLCVSYTKSLTCNHQNKYTAVLQIDHVRYFGGGNSPDIANDNAASQYFYSIDTGVHCKLANREWVTDVAPSLSIIKFYEMYDELNYRTVVRPGERNMFKTIIKVDSINYYGDGETFQQAAASAADACLLSIKHGHHDKLLS